MRRYTKRHIRQTSSKTVECTFGIGQNNLVLFRHYIRSLALYQDKQFLTKGNYCLPGEWIMKEREVIIEEKIDRSIGAKGCTLIS